MNVGASHISSLLEQLKSEGEFDSLGQFTVSLEKALEKVRSLAELDPTRWLLFGVQAGVAAWAERIQVSLTYDQSLLTLVLRPDCAEFEDANAALAARFDSPALSYLHSAILWARAHQPLNLDLLYSGPRGGYLLKLAGEEPERAPQPASDGRRLQLSVSWSDRSQHRVAACSHELASRLSFCPIPVLHEGLPLNSGTLPSPENPGYLAARMLLLAASEHAMLTLQAPRLLPALSTQVPPGPGFLRQRGGEPLPILQRLELGGLPPQVELRHVCGAPAAAGYRVAEWQQDNQTHQLLLHGYAPLELDREGTRVAGRALFLRAQRGPARLHVVQHGCRLQPVQLALEWAGWQVIVAANSVSTDLSANKPVKNDALAALCSWATEQIRAVHQRAHRDEILRPANARADLNG